MDLKKIFIFGSIAAIGGCAIAPGMRMDMPSNLPTKRDDAIKPEFTPITSQLAVELATHGMEAYQVGPQDVVGIAVWNHPEFIISSNSLISEIKENSAGLPDSFQQRAESQLGGYLVAEDGTIFFPLIGKIKVSGKSVDEIRGAITKALTKYIHNPQVGVRVAVFRSKKIYVMGEVAKPGLQPISDSPLTLADALNLAGGLNSYAADPRQIFVIRGEPTTPKVYWLNAKSPTSILLAQQFQLQAQDIIFVATSDLARWNRGLGELLPSIQTLWYTRSLTR
jgi:protein involved in polysaccharide export with SLBB domain